MRKLNFQFSMQHSIEIFHHPITLPTTFLSSAFFNSMVQIFFFLFFICPALQSHLPMEIAGSNVSVGNMVHMIKSLCLFLGGH